MPLRRLCCCLRCLSLLLYLLPPRHYFRASIDYYALIIFFFDISRAIIAIISPLIITLFSFSFHYACHYYYTLLHYDYITPLLLDLRLHYCHYAIDTPLLLSLISSLARCHYAITPCHAYYFAYFF